MAKLNDYRLKLGKDEYAPIMLGGMGMDISTTDMVLAAVKLGGIAHLSDALATFVSDKHFGTTYTKDRLHRFKDSVDKADKSHETFPEEDIRNPEDGVRVEPMSPHGPRHVAVRFRQHEFRGEASIDAD